MYNTGSNVCLYNNAALIVASSEELPHRLAYTLEQPNKNCRNKKRKTRGTQFQKTKNCDTDA